MSSDDVVIEARGLRKTYEVYERPEHRLWQLLFGRWRSFHGEFTAVHDFDLRVERGETVGIVGRNGSGKSTLLKMISGVLHPTQGSLAVHGHVAPLLALGVGFNPDFTGRENARMNATLLGLSDEAFEEGLDDLIAFADIGDFFDQPVRVYSSGMVSRLAFAVAIHSDPEILVVDEVLAVGDEAFARKCFARLETLKQQGSTILFVSHASNLVVELCDRALLLEAGRLVLDADPKTVVSLYHRLLYAAPEVRPRVLREIHAVNEGGALPESSPSADASASPDATDSAPRAVAAEPPTDFLDPELRPHSTVEYESLGARILEPRILDARDRPVNVLSSTRDYSYVYDVEFTEPGFGVRFGMMVKLVTGFELAGQASHAWARGIECIEAGTRLQVRFRFRPRLVRGTYFLNAGVLGLRDGAEQYLHRVLDAVMFRVVTPDASLVTGQVDLGTGEPCEVRSEPAGSAPSLLAPPVPRR